MSQPQHPRHHLDEVIHSPVRLSIMATLASVGESDFRYLRNAVEVSDSLLSKHVSTLEAAGYVEVTKGYVGKRPRTWYSLTDLGLEAYRAYLDALRQIVGDSALEDKTPGHDTIGE
jgi:DNA-binding HxlR family transcriptional regulator